MSRADRLTTAPRPPATAPHEGRHSSSLPLVLVLGAAGVGAGAALATRPANGTLRGTGTPGSTVTITGPDGKLYTVVVGADGTWSISLPPGTYAVTQSDGSTTAAGVNSGATTPVQPPSSSSPPTSGTSGTATPPPPAPAQPILPSPTTSPSTPPSGTTLNITICGVAPDGTPITGICGAGATANQPSPTAPAAPAAPACPAVHVATTSIVGGAARRTFPGQGWLCSATGQVWGLACAPVYGSMAGQRLNAPIVGMASTNDGTGYWLVGADGGVFAFGSAAFKGTMAGTRLNKPVVAISAAGDGGYVLFAGDGGVFNFTSQGMRAVTGLSAHPIVGGALHPGGGGWAVASDGGVFTSDAPFYGSMGGKALAAPVVGMFRSRSGAGYALVGADGGIFTFGDEGFHGSLSGTHLNCHIVAGDTTPDGGYVLFACDGGVFNYTAAGYGLPSGV